MNKEKNHHDTFWNGVWRQLRRHHLGMIGLVILLIFCMMGIYAPFFASSKPLVVIYEGQWFFPFFRYLFYTGFYTKRLDIFFNLLMFTLPSLILALKLFKHKKFFFVLFFVTIQTCLFFYLSFRQPRDPASDIRLTAQMRYAIQNFGRNRSKDVLLTPYPLIPNWEFELQHMNAYAKLNMVLQYQQRKVQFEKLHKYIKNSQSTQSTLWSRDLYNLNREKQHLHLYLKENRVKYRDAKEKLDLLFEVCLWKMSPPNHYEKFQTNLQRFSKNGFPITEKSFPTLNKELDPCNSLQAFASKARPTIEKIQTLVSTYENAEAEFTYRVQKQNWLNDQLENISFQLMPLIRPFHWQDDAGGEQSLNQQVPWWQLTRISRKDLVAALIFGIRISLVVGITAVFLALIIGIPVGALSGYYGGKWDIVVCRLMEIWESMPVFFMLLLIVAILQSKSIFLIIGIIGMFSWTGFSRFIRGEFFKQRNLAYVEACYSLGFSDLYVMFVHILPNAIPPLLTLMPFAVMGAITSEAGLSFLGLGEEDTPSWGVLMDEGRTVFPGESYLLWPPAILLTILLVAIALVGDALRDAIDPKLHKN